MTTTDRTETPPATDPGATAERQATGERRHLGPRLLLAFGVVAGGVALASLLRRRPAFLALNADVYRVTARAALSGGDLYAVHPPEWPAYRYRYPPVVVAGFLPLAALSRAGALVAVDAVSVVAALGFARLLVGRLRALGVAATRLDAALVTGFVVASVHVVPTLYYGNVNLLLAATTGTGLLWLDGVEDGDALDRGSLAGVALAVPAVVKLFPAAVGLWAVRRRAWRAVGAAVVTGLVAVGASLALFGVEAHVAYLGRAVGGRLAVGTPYPPDAAFVTLRRPLSVLGLGPTTRAVVALLAVVPVVAYANTRVRTPTDALVGLYALVASALVVLPSYFLYLVFLTYPLVALSYLLRGRSRLLFLAGAALVGTPVTLDAVGRVTAPVGGPGPLAGVLTVATPPLLGVCLTLAACVRQRRRRTGRSRTAGE